MFLPRHPCASRQTDLLSLGDKWNALFSLAMRAYRRPAVDVGYNFGLRERRFRPRADRFG